MVKCNCGFNNVIMKVILVRERDFLIFTSASFLYLVKTANVNADRCKSDISFYEACLSIFEIFCKKYHELLLFIHHNDQSCLNYNIYLEKYNTFSVLRNRIKSNPFPFITHTNALYISVIYH